MNPLPSKDIPDHQTLHLAYLSVESTTNAMALSGTCKSIADALTKQGVQLDVVSPLRASIARSDRCRNFIARIAGSATCLPMHRWQNVKSLGRHAADLLTSSNATHILAPSCLPVAALEDTRPKFIYSDATVPGLCNYYPELARVTSSSYAEALDVENSALQKCRHVFFASEWALKSAVKHYGLSRTKLSVIPRGANLDGNLSYHELQKTVESRLKRPPKILAVGRDWHRKGLDVACEVVSEVHKTIPEVTATIVGALPPRGYRLPSMITVMPPRSRLKAKEQQALRDEFSSSTVFLLPSRAEAMGIVLAEAASFGLPAVARNTGGTSSVVMPNKTGMLVPELADPGTFSSAVLHVLESAENYRMFATNAWIQARDFHTWASVAHRLTQIMGRS